ncbi:MAG: secondary thiamine-phosphate synthase enzyme YjbQ [Peptostreptococcaceae bacterium]
MKVYNDEIILTSNGKRVTYHQITNQIKEIVKKSNVKNGICVVSSQHTTCSVIFEEYMHDVDFNGDEFLQVDLNNIMDKIVPRNTTDQQYRHPGPMHTEFAMGLEDPNYPTDKGTLLNTDAHIRASMFGSSETFIIQDEELLIGTVGYIYFIDWDQNRVRNRHCRVIVMGE